MKLVQILSISILTLICLAQSPAHADSNFMGTTSQNFSSGGDSMASRFGSPGSMAYRNMMSDGPAQVVDEYYEQGCRVQIWRFWRPVISGYVVRTVRTCP